MSRRLALRLLLTAALLAFIWGNSAIPAEGSNAVSSRWLKLLFFLPQNEFGAALVRKLAHFAEFAALGLLSCPLSRETGNRLFPYCCGFGPLCACVDETIQYFTPGRNAAFADILLDSAGFFTGLLFAVLGYTLYKKMHFGGTKP